MTMHRATVVTATVLAFAGFGLEAWGADAVELRTPLESTTESRVADMHQCASLAREIDKFTRSTIGRFEISPLLGQATGRFLFESRPSATDEAIPVAYASALGVKWEQSAISDRYVLCLLAKGYAWPENIALSSPIVGERKELAPEREASTLYEAGRVYRLANLLNESERLLRQSVEMDGKRLPDDSEWMIVGIGEVAILYLQLKRLDDGLVFVRRLAPNAERYPRRKQFLWWIFSNYAEALKSAGRDVEAKTFSVLAAEIKP